MTAERDYPTTDDHKAEAVTRAIYDTDPWFDNGERLLTFDEAKPRGLIRNSEVAASAILARFNVTERDEDDWEFRCTNPINVSPCAPGHRCEGGRVERRHPASEWEAFDD